MSISEIRRALFIRFTRRHLEREIDEELAGHIERRTQQLVAAGMDADDAGREATRRFGDVHIMREACLEEDLPMMRRATIAVAVEQATQDVRFAARSLRRSPWFTAVALSTLVIGIASVTAIFSFVYAFYWRPLPFKDATRIVAIDEDRGDGNGSGRGVTMLMARRIATDAHSYSRIAFWDEGGGSALIGTAGYPVSSLLVDTSFATLLGLHAQIGRLPSAEEILGNAPVAAISDALWRSAYGADDGIAGKHIRVGNSDLLIVGVLPAGFGFPRQTTLIRPLPSAAAAVGAIDTTEQYVGMLGHLKPGVTRAQAAAELRVLAARALNDPSLHLRRTSLTIAPEMLDRRASQALPLPSLFVGAGAMLLLLACANVANLFLVRAAERRGEMAVRASLGAGRARLIAQAITEALLLASAAGALGLVLSAAIVKLFLRVLPTSGLPGWMSFGLDGRIAAVTAGIALLVTLLVGLTPALEGTRFDLARALKIGGDGGIVGSAAARSARRGLAIQMTLSMALFIGAGLFVRSYQKIARIDYGYAADAIRRYYLFFDDARYPSHESQLAFAKNALEQLHPVGDAAVRGGTTSTLLGASKQKARSAAEAALDYRLIPDGDTSHAVKMYGARPPIRTFAVDDGYFHTLGLSMVRGRGLEATDGPGSLPVTVVSDRLAELLWPGASPIGRTVQRGPNGTRFTVVGVVHSVRDMQGGRDGFVAKPRGDAYFSDRQVDSYNLELIVHPRGNLAAAERATTQILHDLDPQLITRATGISGADEAKLVTGVFGGIIGVFGVAGLLLSTIGVYGVVGYGVSHRKREIGVRLALGATRESVVRLVMTQSMRFVGAGLLAGLLISLALSRFMSMLLFEMSGLDTVTYGVAIAFFLGVSLFACWLPSRAAGRVDPMHALKAD